MDSDTCSVVFLLLIILFLHPRTQQTAFIAIYGWLNWYAIGAAAAANATDVVLVVVVVAK